MTSRSEANSLLESQAARQLIIVCRSLVSRDDTSHAARRCFKLKVFNRQPLGACLL